MKRECIDYKEYLKNKYLMTLRTSEDDFILFNRSNGAILKLAKDEYNSIRNNREISKEIHADIALSRVFDFNEVRLYDDYENFIVTIEMSTLCNLHCLYCYQNETPERNEISNLVMEGIIEYIINVLNINCKIRFVTVAFIGGEPLLHLNKVIQIMNKIDDISLSLNKKVNYHFDTNGTIDFSAIYNNRNNIHMSVTLSNESDHNKNRPSNNFNSYGVILESLKRYSNQNNTISIRYNTNHENINEFEGFVKLIKQNLPHVLNIDPMYTNNYDFNNLEYLNQLTNEEFSIWNSTKAIDILINNDYIITGGIPSVLQLCMAYQPYSCKIQSDGYVVLCDSMECNKELHISELSKDITMLAEVFSKYKNYNPLKESRCKECGKVIQCQGELLCRTDYCDYSTRYNEHEFIKTYTEHILLGKENMFQGMAHE